MKYKNEIKQITSRIDDNLLALLEDNRCIIAGGALTSVFTNKEINDIDVYFRDSESFSNVVREIMNSTYDSEYDVGHSSARVSHYTNKSILLNSNGQDVQLIAYQFFPTVEDIFKAFDFTINMAAIELDKDEKYEIHLSEDFLKHNAQRYLGFNQGTTYPLVSALRVSKYKERGYDISKAQMIKLLLAINNKNINSWEVLVDQLGSFYGLKPDEIFDTTKEFSLQLAMEQLEAVYSIPNKMYKNLPIDWESIYKSFDGKWDDITKEWMENRVTMEKSEWSSHTFQITQSFKKYIENKETKEATANGLYSELKVLPPVSVAFDL